MPVTTHSAPLRRLTFLDLPPETRIMIYKLTCSSFTVHVRPRFLTPDRQLLEQSTIVTLTNCNILSLSKQIRNEALPYVQISPTIKICRSAIVEIHQATVRRPDIAGHSETTCRFLSHISPIPCDLHRTPNFSLLTLDHGIITKYFMLGFDAIKTDCKTIMTKWIDLVERGWEPSVVPRNSLNSIRPWWPANLTWIPGYLLSDDDCITILSHLLLNAGSDVGLDPRECIHLCSAGDLELSTWRHKSEWQNPNTPEVLEEMFKVRQLMEWMSMGDSAETILSGLGI